MDRKRYIENNDFETALESYLSNFERIGDEVVPSSEGLGRITSKAVYADFCDPVYNAAAMDGIEVIAESTLGATEKTPVTLREGVDFNYINTGGAISDGFDAVIMIEDVLQKEDGIVEIITPAHQMQHVRVVGESVSACEMLLPSSHRIRPEDMGCIVSATKGEILVSKTPKVALIPTGGEMIDDTANLKKGKLMESNSHVFAALTKTYGGEPIRFPVVPDDEKLLEEAVKKAVKECDVVVINAGSSAGTKDYTVHIIEKLG
ncbi:MAG: molybdopterin biosynthesis protein, partial [Clostridia bacterium]|nr:molybdopterin biosynthesis protein [Clostridia bacterium]